jgi:hypothetical protein
VSVLRTRPKIDVSLVEEDGRYHVVHAGETVCSTRVLAAAEVEYDDLVERLTAGSRELRARENAHYNMQAVRSDSFDRRAAKARKTGGRGGRGGV